MPSFALRDAKHTGIGKLCQLIHVHHQVLQWKLCLLHEILDFHIKHLKVVKWNVALFYDRIFAVSLLIEPYLVFQDVKLHFLQHFNSIFLRQAIIAATTVTLIYFHKDHLPHTSYVRALDLQLVLIVDAQKLVRACPQKRLLRFPYLPKFCIIIFLEKAKLPLCALVSLKLDKFSINLLVGIAKVPDQFFKDNLTNRWV